ncbi:MAG: ATP-binding protein, partial [Verrucomicrobia bacterium]|nr:ATP-binding protein [Verrucomicrobiota bacterium]
NYEISLTELRGLTTERIRPVSQEKDIRITGDVKINASLEIRHANIIMLILDNLLRNAVQACPPQSEIDLSITSGDDAIDFTVADQGPGLPEHVIEHLFLPCKSTKPGAGGIGLAISKQLSAHLDANLEFTGNIPTGCRFVLSVPKNLFKDYNS